MNEELKPCPNCGASLNEVRQSPDSMLNAEQFDAAKRGDWFCTACPPQGETYRYFWTRELKPALAASTASDKQEAVLSTKQRIAIEAALSISDDIDKQCHDGSFLNEESVEALRSLLANPSDKSAKTGKEEAKPVCWITREQLQKVEDESEDAWVYWAETGHAAEPDEVPLFTHSEQDVRRAALEEAYQAAMSCDGALNNAGAVAMKIRALMEKP